MASTTATKRRTKRRTKAQIETDRRLAALRKNLAAEIEADLGRFAGDSQSPMAGLLVMTRVKVILAFLQAFFPMFIKAPKPRRAVRKAPAKRRRSTAKTSKRTTARKRTRNSRKPRGTAKRVGNGFAVDSVTVCEGRVEDPKPVDKVVRVVDAGNKPTRGCNPTQVKVVTLTK